MSLMFLLVLFLLPLLSLLLLFNNDNSCSKNFYCCCFYYCRYSCPAIVNANFIFFATNMACIQWPHHIHCKQYDAVGERCYMWSFCWLSGVCVSHTHFFTRSIHNWHPELNDLEKLHLSIRTFRAFLMGVNIRLQSAEYGSAVRKWGTSSAPFPLGKWLIISRIVSPFLSSTVRASVHWSWVASV